MSKAALTKLGGFGAVLMRGVTNQIIPHPHQHSVGRIYLAFIDIDDVGIPNGKNLFASFDGKSFALLVEQISLHMEGAGFDFYFQIAM